MTTLRDEALVLRRVPFQDTSLVVHLFTLHHGLLAVMVRGARQTRSPHRAALAGLHTLMVTVRHRTADGLGYLISADICRGRHRLTDQPLALAGAQVALEAVYRGVAAADHNQPLFGALTWMLDALDGETLPDLVVAVGLMRLLTAMGYGLDLARCGRCGASGATPFLSPTRGQGICGWCAGLERAVPLSPELGQACIGAVTPHLSTPDMALLYRMAVAGLEQQGRGRLVADPPFRRLAGW